MKRFMYLAQLKAEQVGAMHSSIQVHQESLIAFLKQAGCSTFSLFRDGLLLFCYLEAEEVIDFSGVKIAEYLEAWPGEDHPRYYVPLLDIFHDNKPNASFPWRQGPGPSERVGAIARLRPEMFSRYVYYHYQLQEEKPGYFSKYYLIGSHEKYLFSYEELPSIGSTAPTGLLSTRNTPDNWAELMDPLFEVWQSE
ncbi:MAG: hypothetical protein H7X86_06085, partial [Gorillibacterium sp.]|nr:hypothetical protein [Gorillibacterium sp.]